MKKFTSPTQKKGKQGEEYAKIYLINIGYTIIETNITRKYGEIDIMGINGDNVHYFEVKSMDTMSSINARENLSPEKVSRLTRMCNFHFNETMKSQGYNEWSLDAILVTFNHKERTVSIDHIKNINI